MMYNNYIYSIYIIYIIAAFAIILANPAGMQQPSGEGVAISSPPARDPSARTPFWVLANATASKKRGHFFNIANSLRHFFCRSNFVHFFAKSLWVIRKN